MQLADLQSFVGVGVARLLDLLDPTMVSAFLQHLRGIPTDAVPHLSLKKTGSSSHDLGFYFRVRDRFKPLEEP
jgi:hypothetical protein